MKYFMKCIVHICLLTAMASCVLLPMDRDSMISRADTGRQNGRTAGFSSTGIYATGVGFEDNYDWRRDTAYGKATGHVILFKGARPVMSVDAGEENEVSTDPDRHHYLKGHLYTEYTDGSLTVIKEDGKEVCRYEGCQMMIGMVCQDSDIYVLSRGMKGEGLTLRKNWDIVLNLDGCGACGGMDDPSYGPSGALYIDEGKVCFAYHAKAEDVKDTSWHLISGTDDKEIEIPKEISTVCDVRSMDGSLYIAGLHDDGRTPVLSEDGTVKIYKGSTNLNGDLRLMKDENGEACMSGTFIMNNISTEYTVIYTADGNKKFRTFDCRCCNGEYWLAMRAGTALRLHSPEGDMEITDGYRMLSCSCIAWRDGGAVIALTPVEADHNPAIWDNGEMTELKLNGYLTSVTVVD